MKTSNPDKPQVIEYVTLNIKSRLVQLLKYPYSQL